MKISEYLKKTVHFPLYTVSWKGFQIQIKSLWIFPGVSIGDTRLYGIFELPVWSSQFYRYAATLQSSQNLKTFGLNYNLNPTHHLGGWPKDRFLSLSISATLLWRRKRVLSLRRGMRYNSTPLPHTTPLRPLQEFYFLSWFRRNPRRHSFDAKFYVLEMWLEFYLQIFYLHARLY